MNEMKVPVFDKLLQFDIWLLDNIFQKISDIILDKFNIRMFNIARLCFMISILWIIFQMENDHLDFYNLSNHMFLLIGQAGAVTLILFTSILHESNKKEGFENPFKYFFKFFRISEWLLIIINIISLTLDKILEISFVFLHVKDRLIISDIMFLCGLYFLSCNNIPRRKSKKVINRISSLIEAVK
jgi:hypothetical protein